jgi:hypothetical protein
MTLGPERPQGPRQGIPDKGSDEACSAHGAGSVCPSVRLWGSAGRKTWYRLLSVSWAGNGQ